MYIYGVLKNSDEELTDIKRIFEEVYKNMPDAMHRAESSMSDENIVYAVVYEKDKAVAAGSMAFEGDDEARITQIAVRAENRGLKYGDMTLRMLLANAFQKGISRIYVSPKGESDGFFKKTGFHQMQDGYVIEKQDFIAPCHQK
ncbi:MAG: GNAT family N-acetyltransferase [Lachnospiraceae bacterium]|nr:GNAT family N-acetyltransferase [Lachnospiraceae bacterium]